MNQSVISQTNYPKKAIIGNDTVCITTIEQIKTINKVFADRTECNELKDSLHSQIKTYDELVKGQKSLIESKEKEIDIQKKIVEEKDTIITAEEEENKKNKRKIYWLKMQRNVLSVAILVSTVVIIMQK